MSLDALGERVQADLALLNYDSPTWVRPRREGPAHVYDVVIVGGGQSGLGAAFGLRRQRIDNILVIDENPAGQEGPWATYARMITLRTPKHLTSIDLGVPSLTFRAWYEAQHGRAGWDELGKIPRATWMAYLRWFRTMIGVPVRNEARLARIEPQGDGVHRLHVAGDTLLARKVVLATGIQGGGQWHVPAGIAAKLPPHRYAHTSAVIDFRSLAGKRIAILGGGASAFDNAQHALAENVAEAHVFLRRKAFQRVNPIRYMERSGLVARFAAMDDADKYAVMASFFARSQPPTNDTFERASAHPGFRLHLGAPWLDVAETAAGVVVTTPQGEWIFDFLLLSTGLVTDPALRPELGALAEDILRWRDRYAPPDAIRNPVIDDHPYLGPGFQYLARTAAGAARLRGLFAFNYSGLISLGLSAAALSGLEHAVPRLVEGIAAGLFADDRDAMLDEFLGYAEEEFDGAREAT